MDQIAQNLREAIQNFSWYKIATELRVTVSIGIANYRDPDSAQSCIVRASSGLLLAKKSGGNTVKRGPQYIAKKQSLNLRDYYS
jgi:PleD family two-component response regulator